MGSCSHDRQRGDVNPPELNVKTALRDVVQHVAAGCGRQTCSKLLNKAWAILLDRGATDTAQVG
jgi:hypothetical protein